MKGRLKEIFSVIPTAEVFADIGCDHGYMAKAVLDGGKCKRAVIADISALCLKKAQDLLANYVAEGRVESYVADGFCGLPPVDCALIAGMGGEEIISILQKADCSAYNCNKNAAESFNQKSAEKCNETTPKKLPQKLVLQPMKNSPKVREKLVALGYKIVKDYTFTEGKKYYDIILAEKGKDELTEEEKEFGRTNLLERPQGFIECLNIKIAELESVLSQPSISQKAKDEIYSKIERMKKYV